ncbi:MAG: ABC transporter permease [Armatimonadetes bacterium RBG_16_67_12]|nr:MAG: ABC transporter permease [Armatimonadetes bacterium RBG_16_67_12]
MKLRSVVVSGVAWFLLAVAVSWSALPILLVVMSSLKDPRTIFDFPPRLVFWPELTSYHSLLVAWPQITGSLTNSLIITLASGALTLILSMPAAYAYSRFRSAYLRVSAFFILAVRMFPPIIITIPLFPFLQRIGLMDRHAMLVVLYVTFNVSLTSWLMKSFIDDVPVEIEEAALIDGCTRWQVIRRVTVPLTAPGLVAATVFAALLAWNEFQFAFIFTSTRARTMPILINEMLGSVTGVEWGPLFAAATLQLAPILVFLLVVQRHLIRGMTVGSVKG